MKLPSIPIPTLKYVDIVKYLAILIVLALGVWGIFRAGEIHVQTKWDIAKVETEKEIAELRANQGKVTERVVIKYVDRVNTVKVKGDTIVQYVDRYITKEDDANCIIPNKFIAIHDAAVQNKLKEDQK